MARCILSALAAAEAEAKQREDRRLVEGGEALDPVAVAGRYKGGVVGEPSDTVSCRPAAEIVERLRHVPVVEAPPRLDAGFEDRVEQAVVERQPRLIRCPASLRQHARPGDRKPVRLNAEPLHEADVLEIAMVVIAGDVAGVVVGDLALLAMRIPDTEPAAVFAHRALDLKTRGRHPPDEIAPQPRERRILRRLAPLRFCRWTGAAAWKHESFLRVLSRNTRLQCRLKYWTSRSCF